MDDELQTMTERKVGQKRSSFRLESRTRCLHTLSLFVFQFHSLSLQKLGVLRSICYSLEVYTLRVISYIITPFSSVQKISLKAEVKGISYLPIRHCHNKTGQFSQTVKKKIFPLSNLPFAKILHQFLMIWLLFSLVISETAAVKSSSSTLFSFHWWKWHWFIHH